MVSGAAHKWLLSHRRFGRSEVILLFLVLAVLASSIGLGVWLADVNAAAASNSSDNDDSSSNTMSFAERFLPPSARRLGPDSVVQRIDSSTDALHLKLHAAKALLAKQLLDDGWRASLTHDENTKLASVDAAAPAADAMPAADATPAEVDTKAMVEDDKPVQKAEIPLPRSRPSQANLANLDAMIASSQAYADASAKSESRSVFQRLGDLFPGRVKLASLTPDSGLFSKGPDLAALGYGPRTAVYDISAKAVYLPSGIAIEAHSGMGSLMDDPQHVNQRMFGATPPATYDLKPRESLFHGVRALRMYPVAGSTMFGRTGLLTHSFMLGPNGDSNGCVSIKYYDRFLKAYDDGEINRLVVVPSLKGSASVSQRASSDS